VADDKDTRTPPYIPYKTFDNFINGLSESGVPHQIDSSLLPKMSGSNRSGLMAALRYLGLTDDNNNTNLALEKLINAKGPQRAAELKQVLQNAYGFLQNNKLDLKRATPALLSDAIEAEGASGGTKIKAVGFFLKAASVAGIEVSPHILNRKHVINTASPTKRAKRVPKNNSGAGSGKADQNPLPADRKLSEQVLAILDNKSLDKDVEAAVYKVLKHLREEGK
jgi:hypothetical protein